MTRHLFLHTTGQDTGGFSWRLYDGFRRHAPGWEARSMAATRTYIGYPEDLPYRREQCRQFYAAADVVHLQNQLAGWELYDEGAGKPTVLQHHGTIFRDAHELLSLRARQVGMVQIASTLDLTLLEPDVTWMPVPYNLAEMQAIRAEHYRASSAIRIAHAPTNRKVKGTDHFLRVIERLRASYPIELVLIEQRSWRECLRMKAGADIFYDQLELGYGCNAVEAWAMGMPVVAGVADPAVRRLMRRRWGRLPFVPATPETLEDQLARLITSARARTDAAQLGREHFDAWHDERVVIPRFAELYGSIGPTAPGPVHHRAHAAGRHERAVARADRARHSLARALARRDAIRAERP